MHTLCIHISAFGDQQFDDFLVTVFSRPMQRSPSILILRIRISTSSQLLFDGFDVS